MLNISNDHLLTETEAARSLGLKVATLRRWRWAGKKPNFLKIRKNPEFMGG